MHVQSQQSIRPSPAQVVALGPVAPEHLRLTTLLPAYTAALAGRGFRPKTIGTYAAHVRGFASFIGEMAATVDLTPANIDNYQAAAAGRWSAASTGKMLSVLRSFCRYLMLQGLLSSDPTAYVVAPRRPKRLPRALKSHELRSLWALVNGPRPARAHRWTWARNRLAVFLMLYTGVRLSEAAALRWGDIDLEEGFLVVYDGKGGKDRMVPLHPTLRAELGRVPPARRRPQHCVLGHADGRPMNPKSLAHLFERWVRDAGLAITAHRLRHTFATQMLFHGADIRQIQTLMGHARLDTTEIYLDVDPGRLRGAIDKIPEGWGQ